MSEFLIIQVGQCGNQIGGLLWYSILREYGIHLGEATNKEEVSTNEKCCVETFNSFFDICTSKRDYSFSNLEDLEANNVKARVKYLIK
ncbi:hypothetical protein HHI36_013402 [Cryptolaemus montrouzieri]|uniref:Tubulin/FtsZ GTPase domain-containing protein n=1 Tax=Cryptolaemus montrouzieri TaxID=559131 RepID=A0ABD2NI20_9CUCU